VKIYNLSFLKLIYPKITFNGSNSNIYITIDDGPTETTPYLLEELDKLNMKATFFVIGKNVEMYPQYYQMILEEGHAVGNHSYSHQSVFSLGHKKFIEDVDRASKLIASNIFRPPYGHISFPVYKKISAFYQIILWSYMTYDFANYNVIKDKKITANSILVLHDNPKFLKTTILQLNKINAVAQNKRLNFSVL